MAEPRGADRRPRAPRVAAEERREQILATAIEVFAELGFRDAGTAEIARRVGVSEPTLYRYFEGKKELFRAALERSSAQIFGEWRALAQAAPSPLEALFTIGVWYLEQMEQDPKHLMLRARAQTESRDQEVIERMRNNFEESFSLIEGLYQQAKDAGALPADTDVRSRAWLFTALGSLLDQTQLLGLRDRFSVAEMAQLVASVAPELSSAASPPSSD